MSAKAKIVFAGVNLLCFVYTLITPSQITFFAVVPTIMGGMSWLFASQEENRIRQPVQYWYISFYVFNAVVCLLLGLTTEIQLCNGEAGHYILKVNKDIMLLANKTTAYWPFALAIAMSVFVLIFAETWNDISNSFKKENSTIPLTQKINTEIQDIT